MQVTSEDSTLSYLPLAHIFDRIVEEFALFSGARIGYFQVPTDAAGVESMKPRVVSAHSDVLSMQFMCVACSQLSAGSCAQPYAHRSASSHACRATQGRSRMMWRRCGRRCSSRCRVCWSASRLALTPRYCPQPSFMLHATTNITCMKDAVLQLDKCSPYALLTSQHPNGVNGTTCKSMLLQVKGKGLMTRLIFGLAFWWKQLRIRMGAAVETVSLHHAGAAQHEQCWRPVTFHHLIRTWPCHTLPFMCMVWSHDGSSLTASGCVCA